MLAPYSWRVKDINYLDYFYFWLVYGAYRPFQQYFSYHKLWSSVLLAEETGVPRENHRPVASHWQTLSHNIVSSTPRHEQGSISQL
jgi:hypothetical protein